MSYKVLSTPSIEEGLPDVPPKEEYISNLKTQCRMQEEAFLVAESLITTYKRENQSLREEVKSLKDQLEVSEERVSQLQEEEGIIKILEKNILKYSERVNGLLQQNLLYEQKIHHLEREIEREKEDHSQQRDYIRQKLSRQKKQESQRKELEGHFHNFLKMPEPEDSLQNSPKQFKNSVGKQSYVTAATKDGKDRVESTLKVLEWKLKQKDEEVIILLKRLKQMEERTQVVQSSRRRERVMTSDSMEHFYSSKKNNVSQFTH